MTSPNPDHPEGPEGPTSEHHCTAGQGTQTYACGEGTDTANAQLAILTWVAGL